MPAEPDDSIHARRPPAARPRGLVSVRVRPLPGRGYVATRRGHAGVGRTVDAAVLDLLRKLLLDAEESPGTR